MELSVGRGDVSQAISAWSFNPSTGDVTSYTFQYELEDSSGGSAPTWIYIDGSDIVIDDGQVPPEGTYSLRLKGTAIDNNSNVLTDRYETVAFTVIVYSIVASSLTDQNYSIGQGSMIYTFPAFTHTPSTYNVIYDCLLDDGTFTNSYSTFYSWLSLSG